VVFCARLPLLSYENVLVLKPIAICVTASGFAYPVPAYVYVPLSDLLLRLPRASYAYVTLKGEELAAVVEAEVRRFRPSYTGAPSSRAGGTP